MGIVFVVFGIYLNCALAAPELLIIISIGPYYKMLKQFS